MTGGGGGGGGDSAEVTTLKVGVIPIADVAPLYLGVEQGFFEEENLKIEPQLAEGGAAIVPSVLSGDYQFGFSNVTSLIIAASKDLPVQIIAQGVLGGTSTEDAWDGVVVPKGSKIKTPKDFEGATVAVNTLNNIGPLAMNSVDGEGGRRLHEDQVRRGPVPGHERGARGRARRRGLGGRAGLLGRQGRPGHGDHESATRRPRRTSPWPRTSPASSTSPRTLTSWTRFKRAIEKSLDYASSHPDEVRAVIGTYTEIPPEVLDKITLPVWKADLNEPTIELNAELAKKYGFIEEIPSLDDLIRQRER